jgi:CheY-like chemotaxis protein
MSTAKKLRVIIIEDNLIVSEMIKKVVHDFGCDVRTFQDPTATACTVSGNLECGCPVDSPCTDVLITDMKMPNMNGLELLKLQQKRDCKALNANKALMSAEMPPQLQAVVKDLGSHFFIKPFKMSELKQWIDECAERTSENHLC